VRDFDDTFNRRESRCVRCNASVFQVYGSDDLYCLCERCIYDVNSYSEAKTIEWFLPKLQRHFHIDREIRGRHFSGKRMRIDAMIKPIETNDWKNHSVAFGVEFKSQKIVDEAAMGDMSRWLAQSVDYANTEWDGYGFVFVLVAGGISVQDRRKAEWAQLCRLSAQLGVGELKEDKYDGMSIIFSGEHCAWSEVRGPVVAKTNPFIRKFGSR
jgi:hypothetical protein